MDMESQALSKLRERTLLFWLSVRKSQPETEFHLFEKNTANGQLQGTDAEERYFHVKSLHTPVGVYPNVLIRSTDVEYLEINL
ncbi:hypothetical protein K493DRAFT_404393 [Basidiobolus meristosporus CBS 931.73]|uniref:Uncharacterized protein n=1 Tax=Basidiobolus meristosporus CBS 931.73 TaxID=1314790 RepID=A0A1Y1Z6D7_9FUNG|nr:hypothetical protein K493DRAFT_404393 [Basidiobolus meristosporus CBS 931.73]|eukprot:ORY05365.1 hypothetical protein K493DRAFT_404393 [Basidiobolus meristosporus CBS 931.73]